MFKSIVAGLVFLSASSVFASKLDCYGTRDDQWYYVQAVVVDSAKLEKVVVNHHFPILRSKVELDSAEDDGLDFEDPKCKNFAAFQIAESPWADVLYLGLPSGFSKSKEFKGVLGYRPDGAWFEFTDLDCTIK